MGVDQIKPGDKLLVKNVMGTWLPAVAVTGVEPTHRDRRKIHDFPVVWVRVLDGAKPLPWPAEDVRPDLAEEPDWMTAPGRRGCSKRLRRLPDD